MTEPLRLTHPEPSGTKFPRGFFLAPGFLRDRLPVLLRSVTRSPCNAVLASASPSKGGLLRTAVTLTGLTPATWTIAYLFWTIAIVTHVAFTPYCFVYPKVFLRKRLLDD